MPRSSAERCDIRTNHVPFPCIASACPQSESNPPWCCFVQWSSQWGGRQASVEPATKVLTNLAENSTTTQTTRTPNEALRKHRIEDLSWRREIGVKKQRQRKRVTTSTGIPADCQNVRATEFEGQLPRQHPASRRDHNESREMTALFVRP